MGREEKKRETRCRIKDAAMRLFARQGYESTTVAQITEAAGVAKGTFFNYFTNKEEIMCDVQQNWAIDEVYKLKDKPGPVIPRLNALLLELVSGMGMNRPLARAMYQSFLSGPASLAAQEDAYRRLYEGLTPVMAAGQATGEFTRSIPAFMLAQMAVQTFYGTLLHYALEQGDDHVGEQMALTFQVFFKGIGAER